jgi:hypothetical protein
VIVASKMTFRLAKYLKDNCPEIYLKNILPRKYLLRDLYPVKIFSLKKEDIFRIHDKKIIGLIYDLRLAYKLFFSELTLLFGLLVFVSYNN